MQQLIVADTAIRQDEAGRYCLNDLHRAAGGAEHHSPNRWTRTDGYQALVAELTPKMAFAPAVSIRGGSAPGTYVCKILVYSYAMWISATFQVKVIEAYDALVTDQKHPSDRWMERLHEATQLALRLDGAQHPAAQEAIARQLQALHRELGIEEPAWPPVAPAQTALPLGQNTDQARSLAQRFWQLVCLMLHRDEPVNHARDPNLVAIRIKDVVAEAARQRVALGGRTQLAQALSMSPHYLGSKPVNSVLLDRAVWCAVFDREAVLH